MIDSDKMKIQEFLVNITTVLYRIGALGIDQLNRRVANLENNIEAFSRNVIKCGLVGITSSGKSSLLNVLLGTGQKILKEQSKATTNTIVFCSKSEEPQLDIHFENAEPIKKRGKEALEHSIWRYTSEDENPKNRDNVKYLRIALPTFILDKDIELADTPGLDAYGLKEHEDLTLREFLPQADIIIHLSSIRSPMKETDRKILNQIMDADQRIIFVQTCKGAVVEQTYGDGTSESVVRLLERYNDDFKRAINPYPKLKDAPIIQVETTIALDSFTTGDLTKWQESGIEEFICVIKNVTSQLQAESTLRSLRKTIDEAKVLNNLIKNTIREESKKEDYVEERNKFLKILKNYHGVIVNDKNKVVSQWLEKLSYTTLYNRYSFELSSLFTYRYDYNPMHDRDFITRAHAIEEEIKRIKADFLYALDSARDIYRQHFTDLGLDIRRTDIQNLSKSVFFLPNVQKKRISEAIGVTKSPTRLSFWREQKEVEGEYIDKNQYIDDLKVSLKLFFEPLLKHMEWWDNMIFYTFLDPLQKKISAIEDDMSKIEKAPKYGDTQCKGLEVISRDIDNLLEGISSLNNEDKQRPSTDSNVRYVRKISAEKKKTVHRNLFIQLGNRLFEGMFHSFYLKCLSEISNKSRKTVVFVGDNYDSQVNFLRRLMRLTDDTVSPLTEIEPPFALNVPDNDLNVKTVAIDGELSKRVSFYVLGNDLKSLDAAQADNLCQRADVIQLLIDDLHRVGSALTDIVERNLLFKLIHQHRDKLLLLYPGAAHFQKDRLHIMFEEVLTEVNNIFHHVHTHWFIYENFEVRYNYFNEFAQKIVHENLKTEQCIREWKHQGIPLDDPFDEYVLQEEFELLVRK
ncbi:MAG: dynamin family protein [Nitrospirae bacterium]|nr:dynamin family protein [Nitrospirota bacterium]